MQSIAQNSTPRTCFRVALISLGCCIASGLFYWVYSADQPVKEQTALASSPKPTTEAAQSGARVYDNRLTRQPASDGILADYPEFVQPVLLSGRFQATPLISDAAADLSVRAWRYSYHAGGVIETRNRLSGDRTALIVVHPWGIDGSEGWITPQPAGTVFFGTIAKNQTYRRHVRELLSPFVNSLRESVFSVIYSLPGEGDDIRRGLYRSINATPTDAMRRKAATELSEKLTSFGYEGGQLPEELRLSAAYPVSTYFREFPSLDAGLRYHPAGFWDLPIPVTDALAIGAQDIVFYDAEGYPALRAYLKAQGVRHVLLGGYATNACVRTTAAGYENLTKDFNVFLVGDATMATFPASDSPAAATSTAVCEASCSVMITQITWIERLHSD